MARFFVGQRVRIVGRNWIGFGENPVGREGRIIGQNPVSTRDGRLYEWALDVAGYDWLFADSHEIEPILPEGAQPSTWDKCVWQPNNEAVTP